jgi:AcrR family transcriptional regulator
LVSQTAPHFIEWDDTGARRSGVLLQVLVGKTSRARDTGVLDQQIEAAAILFDARRGRFNGSLICDVELDGGGAIPDCLGRRLAALKVALSDVDRRAVRHQLLCHFESDALIGAGDQCDAGVRHGRLLYCRIGCHGRRDALSVPKRNRVPHQIRNIVPLCKRQFAVSAKPRVIVKKHQAEVGSSRRPRADAQRSLEAVLEAAKAVFETSGVDAPVRQIATAAGVGIATLYRHFPQRSDLVIAIFHREIDACVAAAEELARTTSSWDALSRWMQRFVDFVATKHGFAAALHSGDPVYLPLRDYFDARLRPALQLLLDNALASGEVQAKVDPAELLSAASSLCQSASGPAGWSSARRMVALLTEGLRRPLAPAGKSSRATMLRR